MPNDSTAEQQDGRPRPIGAGTLPSHEILARRWDKSVSNMIVSAGIGLASGVVVSVVLFKKRTWPIAFGAGFGAGRAYSQGEQLFNPTYLTGYRFVDADSRPCASSGSQ